jgi:hypothetical protein
MEELVGGVAADTRVDATAGVDAARTTIPRDNRANDDHRTSWSSARRAPEVERGLLDPVRESGSGRCGRCLLDVARRMRGHGRPG